MKVFSFVFAIALLYSCATNPLRKARAKVIRIDNLSNPEIIPFEKIAKQYLEAAEDTLIEDSYTLQIFSTIPNAKIQSINQFYLVSLSDSQIEADHREYKILYQGPSKDFLDAETIRLHDFSFWANSESTATLLDIEHKNSNFMEFTIYNRSISTNDISLEKVNYNLKNTKEASAFKKIKNSLPPKDSQPAYYCKLFKKSGYQCTLSKGIAPEASLTTGSTSF
ncbi:MAG: hypothetical protein KA116_06640 [Proteobacteria bacterium]|nr:hypothetical protein [Pseudomonadota bacterium]